MVYDPMVDPEEAEEEFGIKLVDADAMADLNAMVLCVPHRAIMTAMNPCPSKRLLEGGVHVDVKTAPNPADLPSSNPYCSLQRPTGKSGRAQRRGEGGTNVGYM